MPANFEQGGDTGANDDPSIQPIADGEPAASSVTNRPTQNLRRRTEVLKAEASLLEEYARGSEGAYITTDADVCAVTPVVCPPDGATSIPGMTSYEVVPATSLLVKSPAAAGPDGGELAVTKSVLGGFYNQAVDYDFGLIEKGDSLAFTFPRSGAGERKDHTWGDEIDYPNLDGGTITEAEIIKLPQRTVLSDANATFLTEFGPTGSTEPGLFSNDGVAIAGTGLYDANGDLVPGDTDFLWVVISGVTGQEAASYWYDNGGRGALSSDGGATADYLKVIRATETQLFVDPKTPFRKLWDKSTVHWLMWRGPDINNLVVVDPGEATARIEADPLPGVHLVPIVSYDGNGFIFTPNGGYVQNLPARRDNFRIPSDFLDLANNEDADEGAASIGSYERNSSSENLDTNGVYAAAGTVSSQLDTLTDFISKRDRTHRQNVSAGTLAGTGATHAIDLLEFSSALGTQDAQLLSVKVEIFEKFTTSDGVQTALNFTVETAAATGRVEVFPEINLLAMPIGTYETTAVEAMADWVVGEDTFNKRLQVKFVAVGGATDLDRTTAGRLVAYAVTREYQ